MNKRELGKRIRRARLEAGIISMPELARHSKDEPGTLGLFEQTPD